MKYCVYCFLQERVKAKLRTPNEADIKRCRSSKINDNGDRIITEPGYICNGCGAIFEKEYEDGKLVNDEMKNLKFWKNKL